MILSNDILSDFAKITKEDKKNKEGNTVYGTVVESNGSMYVRIDGSDILTPISSTTVISNNERVMVTIKNHTATVVGNMTNPSASNTVVQDISDKIEFITTEKAAIEELQADVVTIKESLTSTEADITNLKTTKLDTDIANATYVTIKDLEAIDGSIYNLEATYATIDFSNIGKAAMEHLYSESGLIKNVTISDAAISGELSGVTISGDLIKGNTIVADSLVTLGNDGLYYKLNADGESVEASQTEYNSLNGSIITSKSVTASKISVDDLVAFDATIGGFTITESSIYSGVKEAVNNTTRGIYLDNDGQISFGNSDKYIKFFKDTDEQYKLLISGIVTANENFKILEDGSMEAINGSFTGTIDADNGSIGGIAINKNGLSASNTSSNGVTVNYSITNSAEITLKNTGSGRDSLLYLKPDYLSMESYSTASGGDPLYLAMGSSGIFMGQTSGDNTAKVYHNGGGVLHLYGASSITCESNINAKKNINSTGYIMPKSGQYIHTANGTSGTSGYVKIAQIKITNSYANQPIVIEYTRRSDYTLTNLFIRFASSNNTDPDLSMFRTDSSYQNAYLYKSATSTWDLYIQKSEAYDTIDVISYYAGSYARDRMTVTWTNEMATSLPSSYTTVNSYICSMNYKFGNDVESFITSRSGGGFDFWFTKNGMRICLDGSSGKIWRVSSDGTWTALTS